jgi:hypothetical protein
MKLTNDYAMACYLAASEFAHQQHRISNIGHATLIGLCIIAFLFGLCSCVESITISGRYADYKITPKKAVVIEEAK